MADVDVKLKDKSGNYLFPQTKLDLVQGLVDSSTGKISASLLPKTGIDIKYNNGLVQSGVTQINFAGTVTVQKTADGVVKARIGQNQNSSNFNTTDGMTNGIVSYSGLSVSSMIMITPAAGSAWGIGDWTAGSSHNGVNKSGTSQLISITTTGNIHFAPEPTSFVVQAKNWAGTTIGTATFAVATSGTITKTGDASNAITCSIASFGTQTNAPAAVGNMGKPTFTCDLVKLIPSGGRFYITITHNNGTEGAFGWTLADLFYNAGTTPVIGTTTATLVDYTTRTLSGVPYITSGTITMAAASIANLNKLAAKSSKVGIASSLINSYSYNAAHLSGYTTNEQSTPSFSADVTLASSKSNAGSAVSINMNAGNAFATSGNKSTSAGNLLIDTLAADTSNDTASQSFNNQTRRLTSSLGAWDSSTSLATTDGLQQIFNTLKYPSVNYSGMVPTGPNYSSLTGFRYYIRKFTFVGTKFGGTFTFGNLAESDLVTANLTIEVSKDGSTWYDITRTKAVNPTNGIRVFADSVKAPKLQFAFDAAASSLIYIRIGMNNTYSKAITSLTFA